MNWLKWLRNLFLPTAADLWDLKARGLRNDGFTEKQIVAHLGPRPSDRSNG